jgi:serine/threonine protein kinase
MFYKALPKSVNLARQRYNKEAQTTLTFSDQKRQCYGVVIYINYYSSGDLGTVMRKYPGGNAGELAQIPEAFIWVVFCSIANALFLLEFGHKEGKKPVEGWSPIRHRDIKIPNIFLGPPKSDLFPAYPYPVLGDFELSVIMDGNSKSYTDTCEPGKALGTQGWMAPEDLSKHFKSRPDLKADVWAAGLVIWHMMNSTQGAGWLEARREENHLKWENASRNKFKELTESTERLFPWPEDNDEEDNGEEDPTVMYTTTLRDLVDECLQANPENRPAATELLRKVRNGLKLVRRIQGDFVNVTSDQIGAHLRLRFQPDPYPLGKKYQVRRRRDDSYDSQDPESDTENQEPSEGFSERSSERSGKQDDGESQDIDDANANGPPVPDNDPDNAEDDQRYESQDSDYEPPPPRSSTRRSRTDQGDGDGDEDNAPKRRKPGTETETTDVTAQREGLAYVPEATDNCADNGFSDEEGNEEQLEDDLMEEAAASLPGARDNDAIDEFSEDEEDEEDDE